MENQEIFAAIKKAKEEVDKFVPETESKAMELANDENKMIEYLKSTTDAIIKVHKEVEHLISLEDFSNLFGLHVQYNFMGLTQLNPDGDTTIELK